MCSVRFRVSQNWCVQATKRNHSVLGSCRFGLSQLPALGVEGILNKITGAVSAFHPSSCRRSLARSSWGFCVMVSILSGRGWNCHLNEHRLKVQQFAVRLWSFLFLGVLLAYAASNPSSQPCVIPQRSRFCSPSLSQTLPLSLLRWLHTTPGVCVLPKRNRPMYMECISSYLFAGAGKANPSGCSEEGPPSPDRNEMNSPASTLLDSDTSCSIPAAQPYSPASACATPSGTSAWNIIHDTPLIAKAGKSSDTCLWWTHQFGLEGCTCSEFIFFDPINFFLFPSLGWRVARAMSLFFFWSHLIVFDTWDLFFWSLFNFFDPWPTSEWVKKHPKTDTPKRNERCWGWQKRL